MKLLLTVGLIFWVICGFAGDWMMDGLGDLHWKAIAWGPLTLIEGLNEDSPTLPTGRSLPNRHRGADAAGPETSQP